MMREDEKVTPQMNRSDETAGEGGSMQDVVDELGAVADQHKGLKTLVLVLGLVIIALFIFVVYAIATKATEQLIALDNGEKQPIAEVAPTTPAPQKALTSDIIAAGDYHVVRPEGSELLSAIANERELLLHFRRADGSDTLILVDRASGKQTPVSVPK
ncbi:hypothetical protein [Kordiimonas sp.]|uniref:hypothetical protein n=1 Tax=Kordiimonas sp. TaxID=1970157 RepID=UPI003A917D93